MLSKKVHKTVLNSLLLLCSLLLCSIALCQQNQQPFEENLQIQFLKDSLEIEGNSFEFNSCSLLYTGEGSLNIEAKVAPIASVNVLTPLAVTQIELQKSQQQFIPIRFIATSTNNNNNWQPVSIIFYLKGTGQRFTKSFWIKPRPVTKWKANLVQEDITGSENEKTVPFSIFIQNTGTVADEYKISLESKFEIQKNKNDLEFVLQPGEKRIATFLAELSYLKMHQESKEFIHVYVKNKTGNEKLLIQNISIIGHQYSQDFYPWKKMPLTVEFSAQSLPFSSPLYSTAIYGTADLGSGRSLTLNSRINDVRQYNTYNTNWIEYQTKKSSLKAGSIVDFHHFLIHGTGVSITNKLNNGKLTAAAIKSSIGNIKQGELQLLDTLGKKIIVYSDNFTNQDADRKIYSSLSVNHLYWKLSDKTSVSLLAGASIESSNNWKFVKKLPGSALGYQIESQVGKLNLHSEVNYYSKSFPGFNRGYTFQEHELSTRMNRTFIGAYYNTNKKVYTNNEDSLLTNLFNINNAELGLKTGFSSSGIVLGLSSGFSQQQQDSSNSLIVRSWRSTANLTYQIAPEYTLSINGSFGLFSIKDRPDIKPFRAYTTYGSFQHKKLGFFFQYSTGPFYYFETKQYVLSNTGVKRVLLSPYYEQHIKKINGFLRTQFMYNKDAGSNLSNLSMNNQLQYSLPKIRADVILNTSYNFNYKSGSYIAATIRKNINLPVFKNAVSNNFTVVLYKDVNNNDQFDKEIDAVLPQSAVLTNDYLVQTNVEGEISFNNIGEQAIKLDFSNTNFNGWIPKAGFIQKIIPVKHQQKTYIPFKQSRYVKGKLILIVDDKSTETFELANIGITATDDKGNIFKTLTDNNGEFILNLPSSTYIIAINSSVFDDTFRPTEVSKQADLINNESLNVTFEIRQKKRQINIHHSSD
ncbi:MAG: hypothetical protein ACM3VS_11485 [Candidatus Dadabacteria bacterium]